MAPCSKEYHREWSLFRAVKTGPNDSRFVNEPSAETPMGSQTPSAPLTPQSLQSPQSPPKYTFVSQTEKSSLDAEFGSEPLYSDEKRAPLTPQSPLRRRFFRVARPAFLLLLCLLVSLAAPHTHRWLWRDSQASESVQPLGNGSPKFSEMPALPRFPAYPASNGSFGNATDVFQVTHPLPRLPNLVREAVLVDATFGDSWGAPFEAPLPAAPLRFTHVYLTLEVSASGVQYDRLAHLFIDDVCLWRTSTAEPLGTGVRHSFTKDVSEYSSVFATGKHVTFHLDNRLTHRLTGQFRVRVTARYFNVPRKSSETSELPSSLPSSPMSSPTLYSNHTGNHSNATTPVDVKSIVAQLGTPKVYAVAPPNGLFDLPNERAAVALPKLPRNVTRAKLQIFTSGSGDDEFWYSHLLDEYKDVFARFGRKFGGHGPCRVVNVYVGGVLVASANPNPVIFTGGFDPKLWRPVVSVSAFDILAYEVDLTALLPLFWDAETEVELQVGNCLTEPGAGNVAENVAEYPISAPQPHFLPSNLPKLSHTSVSGNWWTAANLLAYSSPHVVSATGKIEKSDPKRHVFSHGYLNRYIHGLNQVVQADLQASVLSTLNFTLTDRSVHSLTVQHEYATHFRNYQKVADFGSFHFVSHTAEEHKTLTISESVLTTKGFRVAKEIVAEEEKVAYPLAVKLREKGKGKKGAHYSTSVADGYRLKKKLDGSEAENVDTMQKSHTSGSIGKHGRPVASLTHTEQKYKYKNDGISGYNEEFALKDAIMKYCRKVEAKNGIVVKDKEKLKTHREAEDVISADSAEFLDLFDISKLETLLSDWKSPLGSQSPLSATFAYDGETLHAFVDSLVRYMASLRVVEFEEDDLALLYADDGDSFELKQAADRREKEAEDFEGVEGLRR